MGDVFVLGAATTRFGRSARTPAELTHEAVAAALARARCGAEEIAAVFVGCAGTGSVPAGDALSVRLGLRRAGLAGDRRAEHVSRSGARALHSAWRAVDSGQHEAVVCVGAERARAQADDATVRWRADVARAYLARSGATVEHLARVAAKNYAHGADNPAVGCRRPEVAIGTVLDSDPLLWPLTRLMVARRAGGAAAVVLSSRRTADGLGAVRPRMRASVLVSGDAGGDHEARAAQLAYWAAGVGPEDLDCAEVHDDDAASELGAYETLQLVPPGEGPELVSSGYTALGGVLPVNPCGGLLSLGELEGGSAVAQVCELADQLTGAAGTRQVPGARVALAHTRAAHTGGRHAAVTILSAT